jgi:hypothetical protein
MEKFQDASFCSRTASAKHHRNLIRMSSSNDVCQSEYVFYIAEMSLVDNEILIMTIQDSNIIFEGNATGLKCSQTSIHEESPTYFTEN